MSTTKTQTHTPGPWVYETIPPAAHVDPDVIAAAHDLLAACHAAHSYFAAYSNGSNEASEKFCLLGKALAKAEGRQS